MLDQHLMDKNVMNNLPFVIRTFDEDLKTKFVSDNFERIFRMKSQDLHSLTKSEFNSPILPEDLKLVQHSYKLLFEEKKVFDIEYQFKFNYDEWFWINEKIFTVYEEDGKFHADGMITDITEKRNINFE